MKAVPQTAPLWARKSAKAGEIAHGIKYSVTLKNARHEYTFDYWGSIRDAEILTLAEKAKAKGTTSPEWNEVRKFLVGKDKVMYSIMPRYTLLSVVEKEITPNAYDILACLDTYSAGDTFEDFCHNYGYDDDSMNAYKTYNAVQQQCVNLQKLYTHEELEALNEIN